MFLAAKEGHLDVTKLLIKAGAKTTLKEYIITIAPCDALLHQH